MPCLPRGRGAARGVGRSRQTRRGRCWAERLGCWEGLGVLGVGFRWAGLCGGAGVGMSPPPAAPRPVKGSREALAQFPGRLQGMSQVVVDQQDKWMRGIPFRAVPKGVDAGRFRHGECPYDKFSVPPTPYDAAALQKVGRLDAAALPGAGLPVIPPEGIQFAHPRTPGTPDVAVAAQRCVTGGYEPPIGMARLSMTARQGTAAKIRDGTAPARGCGQLLPTAPAAVEVSSRLVGALNDNHGAAPPLTAGRKTRYGHNYWTAPGGVKHVTGNMRSTEMKQHVQGLATAQTDAYERLKVFAANAHKDTRAALVEARQSAWG